MADDAMWANMLSNAKGDWASNPLWFLILLLFAPQFTNRNAGADSLAQTVADNHNSDLLMGAIKGNANDLATLASNLNVNANSLNAAINGISSQMASCCCSNKLETQKMGYENQISNLNQTNALLGRLDTLSNGIQQGFASVGYEAQANANNIIQASNMNTQRILDKMCASETQGLRDKLWQLSQDAQTTSIVSQLKTSA